MLTNNLLDKYTTDSININILVRFNLLNNLNTCIQ